ncbi:tautomerase family protein [Sporolactobacillus sp. KGMB 08714]|uniref:tautomerase family protein n=1 Tax=Sporolactobacillus sp. KGMB 08714 TaxID=3064704 RepID=UPI002FBE3F68
MPLVRFDLIEGRSEKEIRKLLDVAHHATVEALGIPENDRYQIVYQHPENEMIIDDTGLGLNRTKNKVVISYTSKSRTNEQKQKLYKLLMKELGEECGIAPDDIMISITSNDDADWSFGRGEAQYLTGAL